MTHETSRAGGSNGGTEAINGPIELHRRIARGFRNREHSPLRMLPIGGGLAPMGEGLRSLTRGRACREVRGRPFRVEGRVTAPR